MTEFSNILPSHEQQIADRIVEQAKQNGVRADVKINHIPPHIAGNILEFLRRAPCTGMESIAWGEAYTFMQQHAPAAAPGVPFSGVPPKAP